MPLIAPFAPAVDETALPALLDAFYDRVRRDPLFRPSFDQAEENWLAQVRRLADSWSSMMLNGGRWICIPIPIRSENGPAITASMFERWGALWRQVTAEMLSPIAAALMQVRSRRISVRLQRALGLRVAEA